MSMARDKCVRVNFELKGELAAWLKDMVRKGYYGSYPEAVRQSLVLLRYYHNQTGGTANSVKKKG